MYRHELLPQNDHVNTFTQKFTQPMTLDPNSNGIWYVFMAHYGVHKSIESLTTNEFHGTRVRPNGDTTPKSTVKTRSTHAEQYRQIHDQFSSVIWLLQFKAESTKNKLYYK